MVNGKGPLNFGLRISDCGLEKKTPKSEIRNPKSAIQSADAFCGQSAAGGTPGHGKGYLRFSPFLPMKLGYNPLSASKKIGMKDSP